MLRQRVNLHTHDWIVDIYYDVRPKNADEILDALWDLGCEQRHLRKADNLLRSGIANQGLTYSNQFERRTLIVIGFTSNIFEFISTLSHEQQHLEQAICRADNLDPYGERIAYVSGEIAEAISRSAWKAVKSLA